MLSTPPSERSNIIYTILKRTRARQYFHREYRATPINQHHADYQRSVDRFFVIFLVLAAVFAVAYNLTDLVKSIVSHADLFVVFFKAFAIGALAMFSVLALALASVGLYALFDWAKRGD